MLHIMSRSPYEYDIDYIIKMLRNDDDLLLIRDGVFASITESKFIKKINTNKDFTLSALKEDIDARGLTKRVSTRVNVISYIGFVNLVVKHCNQINW